MDDSAAGAGQRKMDELAGGVGGGDWAYLASEAMAGGSFLAFPFPRDVLSTPASTSLLLPWIPCSTCMEPSRPPPWARRRSPSSPTSSPRTPFDDPTAFLGQLTHKGTTVSPWIVTLDALKPFACEAPKQEHVPLPYLAEKNHINYDITLEAWIKPKEQSDPSIVAKSNFNHLYWTLTQHLAHHTVNGCNLRPGDMFATGTLSGPEPDWLGCLLELIWNGQKEISVGNSTRKFLEDGEIQLQTQQIYCIRDREGQVKEGGQAAAEGNEIPEQLQCFLGAAEKGAWSILCLG